MGLFDFMKVCLFSEVNGVVTLEGKPVAGAEIVRTAKFSDTVHTDKAVTDADGKFHFDAMYASSIKKILPIEPVIMQTINIHSEDKAHLGWHYFKHSYELNGELDNDLKLDLTCDIAHEPTVKSQVIGSPIDGVCKWK